MKYNNFSEFMNNLKERDLHNHIKLITWAWFHLQKDGWMRLDMYARVPLRDRPCEIVDDMKVHPSFAWGIYQLMSNLNAQQL